MRKFRKIWCSSARWIRNGNYVLHLLDSAQIFCFISVRFRTELLFSICWISRRYSVRYLLDFPQKLFYMCWILRKTLIFLSDCVQKFFSISFVFHAEFLFDTCWIPRRKSGRCLLDSAHKFCYMYVGFCAKIFVSYLLDSVQKFCLISVGFLTEILFDICWIPCTNSLRHLLDSAQKFCLMSIIFCTEILFDICWIPYRNAVWYLLDSAQKLFDVCWIPCTNSLRYRLDSAQKFSLISIGLRTEILLDACCISHRNSVAYMLGSVHNLYFGKPATCVAVVNIYYLWRTQKT